MNLKPIPPRQETRSDVIKLIEEKMNRGFIVIREAGCVAIIAIEEGPATDDAEEKPTFRFVHFKDGHRQRGYISSMRYSGTGKLADVLMTGGWKITTGSIEYQTL